MCAGLHMTVVGADTSPVSSGTVMWGEPMSRDRLCQPGAGVELSRLAVTQMCLQEIFISVLPVSTALCAGQRLLLTALTPEQKEGKDGIGAGFVLYLRGWGLMFCSPSASHPTPSVRSCPLLGGSEMLHPNPSQRWAKKRVKSNRENRFPSLLPELCSLRLKVRQCLEFRAVSTSNLK